MNPIVLRVAIIATALVVWFWTQKLIARKCGGMTGILIVFSLRQVSQLCCTLPPPPGIIWRDPGFPTVLVTYGVSNETKMDRLETGGRGESAVWRSLFAA